MARRNQLTRTQQVGVSRQTNDPLHMSRAIVALAQEAARIRLDAANVPALTDSSTGTPNASNPRVIPAIVLPTPGIMNGVTLYAPKTAFDTAVAAITAGHHELMTKIAAIVPKLGLPRTIAGLTGTSDGTINAITATLTGTASATALDAVTGLNQLRILRNNQSALAALVSAINIALGLAPLDDRTSGAITKTASQFTLANTAATAAAVTTGAKSLLVTEVNAALNVLTNNISTMAASLNAAVNIVAYNGGPLIVAVSSPENRLSNGDVDWTS